MKKFIANYLVSEDGVFLKNGIVVAKEDGTAIQWIDTQGDLKEIAQLTSLNGILMAGFTFVKKDTANPENQLDNFIHSIVFHSVEGNTEVSIRNIIEMGIQIQEQFPEMKIPEIMTKIKEALLAGGGFAKENIAGIFLLTGVNLVELRFTPKSRLKKIL